MTDLASDFKSAAIDQDLEMLNERFAHKLGWTHTERFESGVRHGLSPKNKDQHMSMAEPLPDYARLISEALQVSTSLAIDICQAYLRQS